MSQSTIPAAPPPSIFELFRAFAGMSLAGFGGVLPWARRAVVEERKWMTADEFNEAFSFSQLLPGPNIVNFSVIFGARSIEQLEDNLKGAELKLSAQDVQRLDDASAFDLGYPYKFMANVQKAW